MIHKALSNSDVPEIKVQIKDGVRAVVKEDLWSESFGKVSVLILESLVLKHELMIEH